MSLASRGLGPNLLDKGRTNLSWLIQLRWAAVAGQLGTILFVAWGLGIELPLLALFLAVAFEGLSNLGLMRWTWKWREAGSPVDAARRVQASVMVLDTLLLAGLLFLTGGVANPFTAFFFVHLVLAAVLLPPSFAAAGTGVVFACVAILYIWARPLPALNADPDLALAGRAVALAMTASITVAFVTQVTRALARRNQQLDEEREHQARTDRLEALGTLAAGAAHELATPLSTIAVVAKELELLLARSDVPEVAVDDARLVRSEVARCRRILDRMSMESGDQVGESLLPVAPSELIEETLAELTGRERVTVAQAAGAAALRPRLPREAVAMALRNLLSNALDASPEECPVELGVDMLGTHLVFSVRDHGPGMEPAAAARATDPFFTTKEPGEGMGLGLFLARSVTERLGGELTLESRLGEGTLARMLLPLLGPAS